MSAERRAPLLMADTMPCLCDDCECPFRITRSYPPICDHCQHGNHLGVRLNPLDHKEEHDD